ncbi:MAG: hybrid sensor histidine kinase/response regulator [Abditibacteriales bacterium]|nr:hybrid sensor histidine kinase/response regulator [Abditibacteriales bacterium]MDW8365716.1 hybrid sensor histidine kinase/response regulator [Abditibacteriales bacterium]
MSRPHTTPRPLRVLWVQERPSLFSLEPQALAEWEDCAQIAISHSAFAALEELSQGEYDLAVVDYHLRDLSGLALMRLARQCGVATPFLILCDAPGDGPEIDVWNHADATPLDPEAEKEYLAVLFSVARRALRRTPPPSTSGDCVRQMEQACQEIASLQAEQSALLQENARLREENQRLRAKIAPDADPLQEADHQQALKAERLRILGLMAAGISHNLNNELNGIIPHIEWLLYTKALDPDVQDTLQIIHRSATKAAAMVQRISTFAHKSPQESFVALNPNELIEEAVLLARHRWRQWAARQGVDIHVKTVFSPVPCVFGDLADLHGVLTNLLLNAVDAMPHGGTLTLRTRALTSQERQALLRENPQASSPLASPSASSSYVAIEISDTGAGMSEDVQRHLFEPFFSTKGADGTGLGLSTSYSIIAHHGGEIFVHTEEGKGTTFTLLLPAMGADGGAG